MAGRGLFDPLGMDEAAPGGAAPERARGARVAPPLRIAVPALLAAAATALAGFAWLRDDGDRGQPRATVPITYAAPAKPAPPSPAPPLAAPQPERPALVPAAAEPPAPVSFASPTAPDAARPGGDAPRIARDDQDVEIQNGVRVIRPRGDRPGPDVRGARPAGGAPPR